jgi:hypothetical protein
MQDLNLSFVKHRYMVSRFAVKDLYNVFEIELPTSVSMVKKIGVSHDYFDANLFSLGDVAVLTRDKHDIVLKSALYPDLVWNYVPNAYQKCSFQGSVPLESHYVANSMLIDRNDFYDRKGDAIVYKSYNDTLKNHLQAIRPPEPTDDLTKGFQAGSSWVYGYNIYTAMSVNVGAAVWSAPIGRPFTRNMAFEQKRKFLDVAVESDSRFLKVIVNKRDKTPDDPNYLENGTIKFNLWVYLICENVA